MGKQLALVCVLGFYAAACTSSSSGDEALVKGFNPPPVADGYTRYILPAVHDLHPGDDKIFCQWVALANASDMDVVDIRGYQSVTGHHAVFYSTSEIEDVGTSRECTTADMISIEFLGGIGGEGGATAPALPDGYVFRHRKERMLLANAHYLNVTDTTQDVQSVLDIKLATPSSEHIAAGMAVINSSDFQIPANTHSYSTDAYCTWPQDVTVLMSSNHMHANGVSVTTDVKRTDGKVDVLAKDTSWSPEQAFNPTWTHFPVTSPMKLKAGDQMHIKCTWDNNTSSPMAFPDEMCAGIGFYTESPKQIVCDATQM